MNFIRKWLSAPSGEQVKLAAVELWYVRWYSRHGEWSHSVEPEVEAFTSYEDAKHFKQELEAAFELIRHSHGNWVDIEKA